MARFLSRQFRHHDRIYHLDLNIDRIAALREELSITITARSYSLEDERMVTVEAVLTVDVANNAIVIEIEGEELGRIPLDSIDVAQADAADDGAEDIERTAWDALAENLTCGGDNPVATTVEAIIEAIPTGDPLLGCLLKGAISASVGQIIRCHGEIAPHEDRLRQKLRSIARCLGVHGWEILGRATARSLRCMMRGG